MTKVDARPTPEAFPPQPPATPAAAKQALAELAQQLEAGEDLDREAASLALEGVRRFAEAPGMREAFAALAPRFAAHAKVEANPELNRLLCELARTGRLDAATNEAIESATGKISFAEGRALEAAVVATTLRAPQLDHVRQLEQFLDSGVRDRDTALGQTALGALGKIALGGLTSIGLLIGNPGPEVPILIALAAGFGIPASLRSIGKAEESYGVKD